LNSEIGGVRPTLLVARARNAALEAFAGFDWAVARIRCYDWQTSVIVTKKANGISRQSFASTQYEGDLAPGYVKDIISFFPKPWQPSLAKDGAIWGDMEKVNWE
jgi:hypothetical protein